MCEVEVFKGSFDFHSHYFSVQKKKKKKKKKKKNNNKICRFYNFLGFKTANDIFQLNIKILYIKY